MPGMLLPAIVTTVCLVWWLAAGAVPKSKYHWRPTVSRGERPHEYWLKVASAAVFLAVLSSFIIRDIAGHGFHFP